MSILGTTLLTAVLTHATAGEHHTALGVGVGWHDGPQQVVIGLGPRLSHRFIPRPEGILTVGGGIERLWFVVPTWGFTAGAGVRRPTGRWHPSATLELAAYPSRLIKLTPEHPTPPVAPATALRARLSPLSFDFGDYSAISALELAPGLGLDTPADTLAFGITVFSMAHRW